MSVNDVAGLVRGLPVEDLRTVGELVVGLMPEEEEVRSFYAWVVGEPQRRQQQATLTESIMEFTQSARDAGILPELPAVEDVVAAPDEVPVWGEGEPVLPGEYRRVDDGRVFKSVFPGANPYTPGDPLAWAAWEEVDLDPTAVKAWRQPLGAHDAYPTGGRVTFMGEVWESVIDGNVWSPSTYPAGWRLIGPVDVVQPDSPEPGEPGEEVPDSPEPEPEVSAPPAWRQPTGGHDAYRQGDRVIYNGTIYESTINGNVWAPDAYPAGWKKL